MKPASAGVCWDAAPVTEAELLLVYAALLAHGTELNAASVALMIPGLTEQAIADAMRLLEDEGPLRKQRVGGAVSAPP